MQVEIRKLEGNWDLGYALHKHTLSSVYIGDNEFGRPQFNTKRSEPGEALFQLKYRSDWSQVAPLSAELRSSLLPLFGKIGLIIPTPASTTRARQPVNEIANELGRLTGIPVFDDIIVKSAAPEGSPSLKNLQSRDEKDAALEGRFKINPGIINDGCWNALVVDDLFDTGATLNAVCGALRTYKKIRLIYVATVTWK